MRVARPDPPRGTARRVPSATSRRAMLGPLAALLIALGGVVPAPAVAAVTWSRNLYVASAMVYQDPYYTACTAASTMIMLNTIAARGAGGPGFAWTPYRVQKSADPFDFRDMTSILGFERANDTLRASSPGSDAHGWRNALNYYGWGGTAVKDPTRMVYVDLAFRTFDAAVKGAVKALARRNMPVGLLGWAGGHAQVMTGYIVVGQDPAISDDFTVRYIFLTDPLRKDAAVNKRISLESLRSGPLAYRFQWYRETDSPYDDPSTPGVIRSSVSSGTGPSEWYHRFVIVAPLRKGIILPDPVPTPTPGASAPPSGVPSADPGSSVPPTPDPATTPPDMTAAPTSDPTIEPTSEPPTLEPPTEPPTETATETPTEPATPTGTATAPPDPAPATEPAPPPETTTAAPDPAPTPP